MKEKYYMVELDVHYKIQMSQVLLDLTESYSKDGIQKGSL